MVTWPQLFISLPRAFLFRYKQTTKKLDLPRKNTPPNFAIFSLFFSTSFNNLCNLVNSNISRPFIAFNFKNDCWKEIYDWKSHNQGIPSFTPGLYLNICCLSCNFFAHISSNRNKIVSTKMNWKKEDWVFRKTNQRLPLVEFSNVLSRGLCAILFNASAAIHKWLIGDADIWDKCFEHLIKHKHKINIRLGMEKLIKGTVIGVKQCVIPGLICHPFFHLSCNSQMINWRCRYMR